MILESGTRSYFKGIALKVCTREPVPGELFAVAIEVRHLGRSSLWNTEFWLMLGGNIKSRELVTNTGRMVTLPLPPRWEYEFRALTPIGDDVFEEDYRHRYISSSPDEWDQLLNQRRVKFIGYADDAGDRNEIRVQNCSVASLLDLASGR